MVRELAEDLLVDVVTRAMRSMRTRAEQVIAQKKQQLRQAQYRGRRQMPELVTDDLQCIADLKRKVSN